MIYCDYAATTPMSDIALHVYQEVAKQHFGNASSLHDAGGKANDILENARKVIAKLLNSEAKEIVFTSGGTEANILAVDTLLRANRSKRSKHIITTMVEHSSLYYYMKKLAQQTDIEVTFLSVNTSGQISLSELEKSIQPNTCFASIQHVNGETGFIQPIKQIGELLHKYHITFHSDMVQSFGKIAVEQLLPYVDCATISSHKVFGPKGIGAIYFSKNLSLAPHPVATNHEHGLRPGTVNVPSIAAFAAAALETVNNITNNHTHLLFLQKLFMQKLKSEGIPLQPITSENQCPSIIGCISEHVYGDYLMLEYNRHGIAISTGSACSIGQSQVPKAIQPLINTQEEGKRFVRFSFSHQTTKNEIEKIIATSTIIFKRLKEERQ
ncbi:IscS subfamily cysteine desulfurase [Gracilibacillus sp. S3-1-1]|uniref:IscS subfamily cysteine desulfurase n=1 Tax=Gracilibacillus pellucidus TaxID=3095368 RepID=A0ACC6M6S2_9BACI|nr:IscS subfamily cysteine desulfurase [Gracilibacillus sp. S3-1-1]MDX8046547.1 IscS subfamily cysteine desulfurase [Gracilibacillus sp. S3-1-1]